MMRPTLIAVASLATLTFSAGVYFALHPLLILATALIATGTVIALAAGSPDQA